MTDKPKPYAVWWLPEDKETHECRAFMRLDAAERLAKKVGGTVYERKNVRPSEDAPGLWDFDEVAL